MCELISNTYVVSKCGCFVYKLSGLTLRGER